MEKILLKEDIEKKIISLFESGTFTKEEYELILKYHLSPDGKLPEEDIKRLEELYLRQVLNTDLYILGNKEIKTLVSCVSFSSNKKEIYEELPIFKSLRVFKNISKIYLPYTKESKENYKAIKDDLKNKNIEVIGKEIKNDSIKDIYDYVRNLAIKEDINKDNTILDVTLGLKMSGIALYKISAEHGITSINWKELQLPVYNKTEKGYVEIEKVKRIPFTTKMTIMEEPLKESIKNYENLNDALEKGEYNLVSSYYRNLGRKDLEFFFEELDKIFNFETMSCLDSDKFYNKVKVFLKNILSYENFNESTKKKIKGLVCTLLALVTFDEYEDGLRINKYSWFKYPNSLNLKGKDIIFKKGLLENYDYDEKEDIFVFEDDNFSRKTSIFMESELDNINKKDDLSNEIDKELIYKQEVYFYLVLRYFYGKINDATKNKLFSFIKDEISKKISKKLNKVKSLEESEKILFDENDVSKVVEVFDLSEDFKENIFSNITFKDNILKIFKYDIIIDFTKEKELIYHKETYITKKESDKEKEKEKTLGCLTKYNELNDFARLLEYIFKKSNMALDTEELREIYDGEEGITDKTFRKNISNFNTRVIKPLNEIVKREMIKKGKMPKEFMKLIGANDINKNRIYKSEKDEKRVEVNKDYYTMM